MDCSRLKLSIPTYRASNDATTYSYGLRVTYGKLLWDVFHRFSEYLALYDKLLQSGLEAIATPPPKSIGRLNNSAGLEERRLMLETWLKSLATRPDVRTSSPFIDFIEFELHTSCSVPQLAPYLEASCQDARFQLSDFQWVPSTRSIFTSYEEGASMARLGKVWTLVENDELGALTIWGLPLSLNGTNWMPDDARKASADPCLDRLLHTNTNHRCRCLYFHESTGRLFVGLETGIVEVYRQASGQPSSLDALVEAEMFCGLEKEEQLNLHSESVMSIEGDEGGAGRILTVGFDTAVRIVNCVTLETLSGGKLSKRLPAGHHLTVGVLETATTEEEFMKSRMFIGSSSGSVFVFSSTVNPPEWLCTIENDSGASQPVTALELAGSSLLVARKYTLLIYRIGKPLEQCIATCIAKYHPDLKSGRTIRSIAVARSAPLLFMGHTRAISVWDVREAVCVSTFKAHSNGIRRLCVLEKDAESIPPSTTVYEPPRRQLQLLSGAADGCLKLWCVPNIDDLNVWRPADNTPEDDNQNVNVSSKTVPVTDGPKTPQKSEFSTPGVTLLNGNQYLPVSDNAPNTTHRIDDGIYEEIKRGEMKHPPPKRVWESTDEEDSLFASRGFTQVTSHRH